MGIKFVRSLKDSQSSEHGRLSALAQPAEEVLRRYSTHVTSLVEVRRRCRGISFMLTSVAFDQDAGHDKKECSPQSTSESDENNKADRQMAPYMTVSIEDSVSSAGGHLPAVLKLTSFSEKS